MLKRNLQLRPAIAAQAVERVAGQALRMNAQQRRSGGRVAAQISHRQHGSFLHHIVRAAGSCEMALETEYPELSVFGGKIGFGGLHEE